MIFTIKNQTSNTLNYIQGIISVGANADVVVPRDFNTLLMGDANFLNDAVTGTIILNNGATDISGPSIIFLADAFSSFATSSLATLPLYYGLPVEIRQSANTSAGATVLSMRNAANSVKIITIERISLTTSFDAATPIQRSLLRYELTRFNTATPSGGTAITPVKMDNLSGSTSITDARFLDTGLTVTNVVFENPFAIVGIPSTTGSTAHYLRNDIPFKLASGEGLAIRLAENAVTGMGICGEIVWGER